MFAVSALRAAATPLDARPTLDELLSDPRRHFGRREHRPSGRQGPTLKITRAQAVLGSVTDGVRRWRAGLGDIHALALGLTLERPAFVFEATASRDGHKRFLLTGSFTFDEGAVGCVVACEQSQARHRDGQPIIFESPRVFNLEDEVEPFEAMIAVFKAVRDAPSLIETVRPRLLLLGGERHVIESSVQSVAAAHGYRTQVFGRPESNLGRAEQALGERNAVVALWTGSIPHRPDVIDRLREKATKQGTPVLILPSISEGGMIDDLKLELSGHKHAHEVPPRTMAEALARAKTTCLHLVFLPEADGSAKQSPFWRPKDVLGAVEAVDDVVRRWQTDELPAGPHQALQEAPVSYASDISNTAKGKYRRHYEVRYQGQKQIMGPHLKFGKKTPERCARVYWIVDETARTFVIGHFGRHLPDDTG